MPDRKDTRGYEPAPWEEPGKRHTDSVPKPPGPPQPARPPQAPPAPYIGNAPAGGEPAPAPTYHQPPPAPGLQNAPQQAPGIGGPSPEQNPQGQPTPYGHSAMAYPPMHKPSSALAMISLILVAPGFLLTFVLGLLVVPIYIAGIVLGVLGLRETGKYGTKSGRGMAIAGTITNSIFLTGTVALTVTVLVFFTAAASELKEAANIQEDAQLIIERVGMYHRAKGDLGPDGPQMVRGLQSSIAVQGSLKVSDLVSLIELNNEVEDYRLEVNESEGTATLYYTDSEGNSREAGRYPSGFSSFYFD